MTIATASDAPGQPTPCSPSRTSSDGSAGAGFRGGHELARRSTLRLEPLDARDVPSANGVPVALNDIFYVHQGRTVDALAPGVLGNDLDPDGDTLTASAVGTVANGTLSLLSGGRVWYRPRAGFVGTDSFTYQVSDGKGGTDTATVTFRVVNTPPEVSGERYAVAKNGSLRVPAAGLLANDRDADGDTLRATLAGGPANGRAWVTFNGCFVYTPNANFVGTDTFTYTVSDGAFTSGPITVSIDVTDSGVTNGSIAGQVWLDANGDGIQGGSNEGVPEGAVVELLRGGAVIDRVVSGQDGGYAFANLPAGMYEVRAVLPGGLPTIDVRKQVVLPGPLEMVSQNVPLNIDAEAAIAAYNINRAVVVTLANSITAQVQTLNGMEVELEQLIQQFNAAQNPAVRAALGQQLKTLRADVITALGLLEGDANLYLPKFQETRQQYLILRGVPLPEGEELFPPPIVFIPPGFLPNPI